MELSRLSISQITTNRWDFVEAVANYSKYQIKNIGIWRDKIESIKPSIVKKILNDHGMKAANLCFSGLFTDKSIEKRKQAIESAKKSLDLTKEIDAGFLLVVVGPVISLGIKQSIDQVRYAMDTLVPYAESIGAKMALEAIHPIDIGRWSAIVTVGQALDIINEYDSPHLGLLLDLYNSWWEPDINESIEKAKNKILGVHVADWKVPTLSVDSRALPGQGIIPLPELIQCLEAVNYQGVYDIEIFSQDIWATDYDGVLKEIVKWFEGLEVNSIGL